MELAFADALPSAHSVIVGDSLRLEVTHMEPFRAGTQLTVWVRTDQVLERLGVVVPGSLTRFGAQPVDWSAVDEVLLTEETSTPVPAAPSAAVVFRGAPEGPLTFVADEALTADSYASARVGAELDDETLRLTSQGLPSPGAGRAYALWLVDEDVADEPHAHTEGEGHADEPVWDSPTWFGTLGATGEGTFTGEQLLASYHEVVLTLEFDRGSPAMGSVVMRGEILAGEGVPDAAREGQLHTH